MNIVTWVLIVVGMIITVVGATLFRRKGDAEISQSITNVPAVKIGLVTVVLGVIGKVIMIFM